MVEGPGGSEKIVDAIGDGMIEAGIDGAMLATAFAAH